MGDTVLGTLSLILSCGSVTSVRAVSSKTEPTTSTAEKVSLHFLPHHPGGSSSRETQSADFRASGEEG